MYQDANHDMMGSKPINKTTDNNVNVNESNTNSSEDAQVPSNLAMFLIQRACKNSTLANYLYWYLSIECEEETIRKQDERVRKMYRSVLQLFMRQLSTGVYWPYGPISIHIHTSFFCQFKQETLN